MKDGRLKQPWQNYERRWARRACRSTTCLLPSHADSDRTINGPELHFGIKDMLGDVLSPLISDIIVALDANEDNRIDLEELRSSSVKKSDRGVAPCRFELHCMLRHSCLSLHGVHGWPAI